MKKTFLAMAAVCLTGLSTLAQADMTRAVRFTLPQPAAVAGTVLPAGDCTVETVSGQASTEILTIRCSGSVTLLATAQRVSTPDGRPAQHSEVVLQHTGGNVILHRVWVAGDAYGYELLAQ